MDVENKLMNSNNIIYLNIGGYKYTTTKHTLIKEGETNFFSGLLSGSFPVTKDKDGYYFIDRNGRYFEPILEYMRSGDICISSSINLKNLVNESKFYMIDLPIERDTSLDNFYATDKWLQEIKDDADYNKIKEMGDLIESKIKIDFIECAKLGKLVKSNIFTANINIINKLAKNNIRKENHSYIDDDIKNTDKLKNIELKKWKDFSIIEDNKIFHVLGNQKSAKIILDHLQRNEITAKLVSFDVEWRSNYDGHKYEMIIGYSFLWISSQIKRIVDEWFDKNSPILKSYIFEHVK